MSERGNALVVAGGRWQVPIIQFLQQKHYRVIVVDPYDDSPGVFIADLHIKADVRDIDEIQRLIAGMQISLVTTDQSDISIDTVSILAERMGLMGNSESAVRRFTNKYVSRKYASEQNIPVPAFQRVDHVDQLDKSLAQIGLPAILKPTDSQASRGIFRIDSSNLSTVKDLATLSLRQSRENCILVEQFFDGVELTVEGVCSGGKHRSLAISMKKHFRTGIASDLEYPAELPDSIESEIIFYNDRYVENSGLDFGITHAEYMYNSATGKICLIEIACRGGGSLISSDIVQWVSGVNVYDILLNDLNGIATDVKALPILRRNAILHFFEFSGVIDSVNGLEDISNIPGVRLISLDFKIGDRLTMATDDRTRHGFVILFAESRSQLENRLDLINKTLQINVKRC